MPKVSKAGPKQSRTGTRPGGAPSPREKLNKFMCARCGKIYTRQRNNFSASQSPLFMGNSGGENGEHRGGYLPVCNHCLDNLYDHYKETLGDSAAAMERICLKFDIYWSREIYDTIPKENTSASRVRRYISRTFLIRYIGKTYDDTLDERELPPTGLTLDDVMPHEDDEDEGRKKFDVSPETIQFWGAGYDEDAYHELDTRYERWTKELPKPLPTADEALYKQIAIQEMLINKGAAAGEDVTKGQNALNTLLGSLRLKPSQAKKDDDSADLETTPLGVWAKRWEEQRPIPEDEVPEPKLISYITTWFYGHLGKAFGLRNVHTKLYDDEIEKYRVERPEFEEESDDDVIVDIFGESDTDDVVSQDGGAT